MVLPLTTQYQLCVCGDTSWWRGQPLKLGHSYTNLPFTNTDGAQQFSTRWGYGGGAGVGESESGSSSVECSTCWLKCISNKKSAPCSTGYSTTRPPVHKACICILYNAVVIAHKYVYTSTMHTDIDNIYEISHVSVYYYIVTVMCTPC